MVVINVKYIFFGLDTLLTVYTIRRLGMSTNFCSSDFPYILRYDLFGSKLSFGNEKTMFI